MNYKDYFINFMYESNYNRLNNYCTTFAITDNRKFHNYTPVYQQISNMCTKCDVNDEIKVFTVSRSNKSFSSPEIWGPKCWEFLHSIPNGYPENPTDEQKESASGFFENLHFMLPCQKCGNHFQENIKNNPPNVNSKKELEEWIYNFHNDVNNMLDKPTFGKK